MRLMSMPKVNNFDLVRLAAALQVAITHSAEHLHFSQGAGTLSQLISLFPGVPIFFFTSGLLISRAFENNAVLSEYARNRMLRIYPALICCFAVSIGSVWLSGYFKSVHPPLAGFLVWALAQLSVGQFYNPDFLRGYGVGVLNGSLWTITVELQFYVLVPVIYALCASDKLTRGRSAGRLIALVVAFLAANQAYLLESHKYSGELWYKLLGVTFVPWFYMFLVGVLAQRNFSAVHSRLGGRLWVALPVYVALAWPLSGYFGWSLGNNLSPLFFFMLACVAFAAAFSVPRLSDLLLRRNDISYGVYLYHMPVVNFLIALGFGSPWAGFLLAMLGTVLLALLSWVAIEKPAMRMKQHAMYAHSVGS
jgi:peptidoglycan/LPS O-acetylase OafA/YrhL